VHKHGSTVWLPSYRNVPERVLAGHPSLLELLLPVRFPGRQLVAKVERFQLYLNVRPNVPSKVRHGRAAVTQLVSQGDVSGRPVFEGLSGEEGGNFRPLLSQLQTASSQMKLVIVKSRINISNLAYHK
jgi:hypothetical protein